MIIKNKKGFSVIEILVGILVFSLGIASVYAIISSTLRLNDYNKNYIIAGNLAREQIELVRNIRDSNYKILKPYNLKNPNGNTYEISDKFEYNKRYTIENNYENSASFPIKVAEINSFSEGIGEINTGMLSYRLCLDSKKRYTYNCSGDNINTDFYKYIYIKDVEYMDGGTVKKIDNAFMVISKVIWNKKGYHEFEIKSIITDWKRL